MASSWKIMQDILTPLEREEGGSTPLPRSLPQEGMKSQKQAEHKN